MRALTALTALTALPSPRWGPLSFCGGSRLAVIVEKSGLAFVEKICLLVEGNLNSVRPSGSETRPFPSFTTVP